MFKEDEIKQKYEDQLCKRKREIEMLTKQSNHVIQERNQLMQERTQLILQIQQEHERAER